LLSKTWSKIFLLLEFLMGGLDLQRVLGLVGLASMSVIWTPKIQSVPQDQRPCTRMSLWSSIRVDSGGEEVEGAGDAWVTTGSQDMDE